MDRTFINIKETEMSNPHPNPFGERNGLTHEILASLTPEGLGQVIAHYTWNQSQGNSGVSFGKGYSSAEYYAYRTNRWIYAAEGLLNKQGYSVNKTTGVVKPKQKVK
jgi:hypothetical protein